MPPYKALSYAWGPPYQDYKIAESEPVPEMVTSIICNGTILRLAANLFSALCYLRTPGISGWILIDAVCTNQLDENEKVAQIYQMDIIYSTAG